MREVDDIIRPGLAVLFVGYNPGARSAEIGRHFAGHSNKFWRLLFAAGITPHLISPEDDRTLLNYNCGITNIVARPSRTAAEITKEEYIQGRTILKQKLDFYKPMIAAYEGIGIYREFSEQKKITYGRQTESVVPSVIDFVMPSPSGLNRMLFAEQVVYYQEVHALAKQMSS